MSTGRTSDPGTVVRVLDRSTVVLHISGDLDAFTVAEFRRAAAQNQAVRRLIIDLGTSFIDSAGLHALVGAVTQVRQRGGEAAIATNRRGTLQFLTQTGFDRIATLSATVEEAISAQGQAPNGSIRPLTSPSARSELNASFL